MFHSLCPACGAPVELASASSAFAVCGYCSSSLSREGDALQRIGEMSAVLEDYSPVQLGCAGVWRGRAFTVIGRIQMAYAGGFWNEWRILFDDNETGWLSDASGQFAMLAVREHKGSVPSFASLTPGQRLVLDGFNMVVADKRIADCVAAQGELPFAVSERWSAQVIDLKAGSALWTLDYGEGAPCLYDGIAVKLDELKMQLLRDADTIRESAGRIKGKLETLGCPSCGASISVVAGATHISTCGSCGSELETHGKTAQLINKGNQAVDLTKTTYLRAGDSGVLQGVRWAVLGIIVQSSQADGESFGWTDYLLFNAEHGFRWLSSSSTGEWTLGVVLDNWPQVDGEIASLPARSTKFHLNDSYVSQVDSAWGSFNWVVSAGDRAACVEYTLKSGSAFPAGSILVSETTDQEQTWSVVSPVPAQAVASAFGKPALPAPVSRGSANGAEGSEMSETLRQAILLAGCGHGALFFLAPSFTGAVLGLGTVGALVAHLYVRENL